MTTVQIRPIRQKDLKHARRFATQGMNLEQYVSNRLELYLYSQYVLSLELTKSTIALGAYLEDQLVGFLFASFKGEPVIPTAWWQRLLVACGEKIIALSGHQDTAATYDRVNQAMLAKFDPETLDGELTFFAVDPDRTGQQIGSKLLTALEEHRPGKCLYLYTDSNCNYPFYLKRGFKITGQKDILLDEKDEHPLTCYLLIRKH